MVVGGCCVPHTSETSPPGLVERCQDLLDSSAETQISVAYDPSDLGLSGIRTLFSQVGNEGDFAD